MDADALRRTLDTLWRMESPGLIARLARQLGDIGRAEELVQDSWVAALQRWPADGLPDNPAAWLATTARNRGIDELRHRAQAREKLELWSHEVDPPPMAAPDDSDALEDDIGDDLLRLMFVACHPVLAADARVALTLRLLGGLSTDEIARAFLVPTATVAQRIVRAKRTLAERQVPFEVPRHDALAARLESVLEVVYLVFNEGYAASKGEDWLRPALCEEALRLGRILAHRLPEQPAAHGLLALMELQASRSAARVAADGSAVLLPDQDRRRWDRTQIARGRSALRRALALGGDDDRFVLQAAIAECHATARRHEDTDWPRIARLYSVLARLHPSPVVELNRVVAVAQAEGAAPAWALLRPLIDDARLRDYAPLWAVRGDLLQKLGRPAEAGDAFTRAAGLSANTRERAVLQARAAALG
jgi:RNA polymerase sigma factor (sigma-70 family)